MNEKAQTLVDMLRADPTKITGGMNGVYCYEGRNYWVATDTECKDGAGKDWRWIGQFGNIHVFKHV